MTVVTDLKTHLNEFKILPAFNFYTLSQLEGILAAVRERQHPTLIQVSKRAWHSFDNHFLTYIVQERIPKLSNGWAFAHLDHGWSLEIVTQALSIGFPSVMIDGSHLPLEENIQLTNKILALTQNTSTLVEGEVGVVGRTGIASTTTSTEEALMFLEQTAVDLLAISMGTFHGKTPQDLNWNIAETIRAKHPCSFALHGGSGVSDADLRRAVTTGFVKFNFATAIDVLEKETYLHLMSELYKLKSNDIQANIIENVKSYCLHKYEILCS
jgi:fructose/tagatose bisphosphate aldolase